MKLSLAIDSEKSETVAPARWPSANFVTQIADALLHLSSQRPMTRTPRANNAYGLKIRIASEGRGKVLSRKI